MTEGPCTSVGHTPGKRIGHF